MRQLKPEDEEREITHYSPKNKDNKNNLRQQ